MTPTNSPEAQPQGVEPYTTRVGERLNLFYHGLKEREKPIMFQELRAWLREMDDTENGDLHSLVCGVIHRHCKGVQLPFGINGLEKDLIEALSACADLPRATADGIDKELIDVIAQPWICVEEKPCEEAVAVHWEEMIAALATGLNRATPRATGETEAERVWRKVRMAIQAYDGSGMLLGIELGCARDDGLEGELD